MYSIERLQTSLIKIIQQDCEQYTDMLQLRLEIVSCMRSLIEEKQQSRDTNTILYCYDRMQLAYGRTTDVLRFNDPRRYRLTKDLVLSEIRTSIAALERAELILSMAS